MITKYQLLDTMQTAVITRLISTELREKSQVLRAEAVKLRAEAAALRKGKLLSSPVAQGGVGVRKSVTSSKETTSGAGVRCLCLETVEAYTL
ncbi:MAG TPA: hypothetical protein V6D14_18990 [Coleofasciculaceae cyanobacterium]|jgi:hypothetical protein